MLNGKELEVGKTYSMRNGGTTKIIGRNVDITNYPFYDNDQQSYTQNGNFYCNGDISDFDLMQELQDTLKEQDMVNSPKHCQLFPELNIEVKHVVAVLANRLGNNGYNGAFIGEFVQMLQYVMRFDEKNGKEDLEKAKEFLGGMIEKYPDVQQLKGQK
jgi:hypothetical protein